jgi:predicted Ser/Thr protein kinase
MGNLHVKEEELVFIEDDKTGKPLILGRGASGLVKLAHYNHRKVAVKYYRDFADDETMMKEAKVNIDETPLPSCLVNSFSCLSSSNPH